MRYVQIWTWAKAFVTLAAALNTSACGASSATVTLTTPARLPLKTIPNVYVIAADENVEALVPFFGEALQSGGVHVEFVTEDEAHTLQRDGRMPAASALVHLRLSFRSGTTTRTRNRNETVCGPRGCITRPRTIFEQVPTLEAFLVVEVREGPSNRLLQEVRFRAETDAGVLGVLQRDSVMQRLRVQLVETLDPQRRSIRIPLRPIRLDGSEAALRALQEGQWTRGRRALEELTSAAETLPDEERAAFYYDLGVARRFDPNSLAADEDSHFDAAEEALQAAVRLDPQPLYGHALDDVRRHRQERAVLAAQAEAAGENFRGSGGASDLHGTPSPPPPAAYQQATP